MVFLMEKIDDVYVNESADENNCVRVRKRRSKKEMDRDRERKRKRNRERKEKRGICIERGRRERKRDV